MVNLDQFKFFLKQRLVGFDVPSSPHFDSDLSTEWFATRLRSSRRYLEYGSGGSTYLAAKLGVSFITVDSDPYFLKSVRKKIQRDGLARDSIQTFQYADIGLTEHYGRPFREWRASARRLSKFRRYSDPPPRCYEGATLPDLVLVDGRFRVACALKALKMLRSERDWMIVVDDYVGRPEYGTIAEFAELDQFVGRMAVFTGAKSTNPEQLERAIARYETTSL